MIGRLHRASRGLVFRLAVLLALALLPIGVIAISQTVQLIEQSNQNAEATLLAWTSKAAGGEEGLIRAALGAGKAVGSFVPLIRDDPALCQDTMSRYLQASDAFSFIGYVNPSGILTCASAGTGQDVSDGEIYRKMRENPKPRTAIINNGEVSGTSVIAISVPVLNGNVYDGHVSLSLPHRRLARSLRELVVDRPLELVIFNDEGVVLSSESGLDNVEQILPADRPLADFAGKPQGAFTGVTQGGDRRVFTVVPVVSNLVYALGVWKPERLAFVPGTLNLATPVLFPVMMWVACLGVAFFAVENLVIRPTRNLRARMLLFMRSRQISPPKTGRLTPVELREIDETWERMARSVLIDEAELEDTIRDKNILLKEVHHRVKNNLQLISSILNMMIRKAATTETRLVLQDVQNRVMSLAAVHQNLYETSSEGRVQADELLQAIVGRMIKAGLPAGSGVQVDLKLEPTTLYPDQAVPLTLATTEAVTNALKYVGRPENDKPWIRVRLASEDAETSTLEIENSTGSPLNGSKVSPGSRLGAQLIKAFASQLNAQLTTENDPGVHRIQLRFPRPVPTDKELTA